MSIDEAIERCETLATKGHIIFSRDPDIAEECNKKYKQLAEWLEELKAIKENQGLFEENMLREEADKIEQSFYSGYNKAIDDFLEKIQWEYLNGCGMKQSEIEFLVAISCQVAEQLKAGGKNEHRSNV